MQVLAYLAVADKHSLVNYVDEAPGQAAGQPPPKKSGSNTLLIVGVVGVVLVVILGVVASLAMSGFRRYMQRAKLAEARSSAPMIARAVAGCGAPLPPSSIAVPGTPPQGTKYMSAATDWAQPAFTCGSGYSMSMPQYFSYQWVRSSDTSGSVIALADLNADGQAECRVEVKVDCPASPSTACTAAVAAGDCEH